MDDPQGSKRTPGVDGRVGKAPPWRWLESAEQQLSSVSVRILLSVVILMSMVTPLLEHPDGAYLAPIFLSVFVPELMLRLLLAVRRLRQRRLRLGHLLLLLFDVVAVISFLPVADGSLGILRLGRLLVLIGYWRFLARDLWSLLSHRDRRYQVVLVLVLGLVLAMTSALLLLDLGAEHDFNGDGKVDGADREFRHLLWWSFRQIQDPGNLVPTLGEPSVVAASLVLTFAGLVLLSLFIGIGTTVVRELLKASRRRPLGLSQHTAILGFTPYAPILLRELADIYRKNIRPYRGAVMAPMDFPDELQEPKLRQFRYLRGEPSRTSDLGRLGIERAKRVIMLGDDSADPDAAVISAILATRRRNPEVPLYPNLEHERNFPAARAAGGPGTHIVGSGSMLGHYVAQNVAFPGIHHLYRQMLRSSGCEIYTYVFSEAERRRLCADTAGVDLDALHRLAHAEFRTTLTGLFVSDRPSSALEDEDFDLLLNPLRARDQHLEAADPSASPVFDPQGRLRCSALRGLIGIALRFRDLRSLGQAVLLGESRPGPPIADAGGPADAAGDGAAQTAVDIPPLIPPSRSPKRVLILGSGPRVPRVVMELVGFFRHLDITVLAKGDRPFASVTYDVQSMLSRAFGDTPEVLEEEGPTFRLSLDGPRRKAEILIMAGDWIHGHRLEGSGAVTLETADVILLLPEHGVEVDSDGRIALDCLHLANLERTGAVRFQAGVHILALVRDPAKGQLLERRLTDMTRDGVSDRRCRYTVIARELARHHFLVQSVFVRGLSTIYLHLLSSRGQYLSRLLPSRATSAGPEGEPKTVHVEIRTLADRLLKDHGVLLVGYETQDDAGAVRVVIDPRALTAGRRVPWAEISALFILGTHTDLEALSG
ncbi:MAG: hypothetical protein AAGD06_14660 [Acidobacteriota bacterium]